MTYQEQLQSTEWKRKRLEIINRDGNKCAQCNCQRSSYVGMSTRNIKTYSDMRKDGYGLSKDPNNFNLVLLMKGNIFLTPVKYVEKEIDYELEELKFAGRWIEPLHQFDGGRYEWICFKSDIKKEDIQPDLNVHHRYYIIDRMAWEYNQDALITLCQSCHQKEHELNPIFVYDEKGEIIYTAENCKRCDGSGYIPEYKYFQNGICFECYGHGVSLK